MINSWNLGWRAAAVTVMSHRVSARDGRCSVSDELVMLAVASESLTVHNLYERRDFGEDEVCLADAWKEWKEHPEDHPETMCLEDFLLEHPEAYYHLGIPVTSVWQCPRELWDEDWLKDRSSRARGLRKARASLEAFINGVFEELSGMLCLCQLVLWQGRVKLVEFRPVPDYAYKKLRKSLGPKRPLFRRRSRKQQAAEGAE